MPRQIALAFCIAFISFLLWNDTKRKPNVSFALWIPWIWFAIWASRPLSLWFGMGGSGDTPEAYLDGSPFDRNIFIALICAGVFILSKRKSQLAQIMSNNKMVILYVVYLGLSTMWSDYAFVSFKRWIKELGHLVMVLIIFTEKDMVEAFKTTIIRITYVLIPLSITFNKYFPEFSRTYSIGGGPPNYGGVAPNKNALGALLMVCGIVIFWSFIILYRNRRQNAEKKEILLHVIMLTMIAFLLLTINSATSLLATLIGVSIILFLNFNNIRNNVQSIKYYVIVLLVVAIVIHFSFDIMSLTSSGLGRDETLTGRTDLWVEVLSMDTNPLIGTGYDSFWLGERAEYFWNKYWWKPKQAHNGYIETYINLGFIGLALLVGIIFSVFFSIKKCIIKPEAYNFQMLRLAFLLVMLAVNITEAQFKGFMWLVFIVFVLKPPVIEKIHITNDLSQPQHVNSE